jgi:hypothetical protein
VNVTICWCDSDVIEMFRWRHRNMERRRGAKLLFWRWTLRSNEREFQQRYSGKGGKKLAKIAWQRWCGRVGTLEFTLGEFVRES